MLSTSHYHIRQRPAAELTRDAASYAKQHLGRIPSADHPAYCATLPPEVVAEILGDLNALPWGREVSYFPILAKLAS